MTVVFSPTQLADIQRHGESTFPRECCGFLVGETDGDQTVVRKVIAAANIRDDSPNNRYAIDPRELEAVEKQAKADGLELVAIYHSHPDAPARPSQYDREHACPWYCYVIVSIMNGKAEDTRNWKLGDDYNSFDEHAILTRGE